MGLFFVLLGLISACGESTPSITVTKMPSSTLIPTRTVTPLPPSPTPIPLAATVNGEEITLQEYEAELNRFLSAQSEENTLVEMRSAGRWGRHDFGENARIIEKFMRDLDQNLIGIAGEG